MKPTVNVSTTRTTRKSMVLSEDDVIDVLKELAVEKFGFDSHNINVEPQTSQSQTTYHVTASVTEDMDHGGE